jgi:hypothetical protein
VAQPVDKALLCRQWIHSREEDTPAEIVYRPAGFSLPPSRGRSGLEFNADGTFKRIGIGATDISNVHDGAWQIDDANAGHVRVEVDGKPQLLKIQDLQKDRLTVKRD